MLWRAAKMAVFTVVALGIAVGSAQAVDEPIPGKVGIIKPQILAKLVAKPPINTTFPLPTGGDNPTGAGGSVQFFDTNFQFAGDETYNLAAGNWIGLGNPAGSKGFKYKGTKTPADPCNVVLIKETVIKAICKGSAVTFTPPFSGDMGVILTTGTMRYCAQFGGTPLKNQSNLFKRKDAPAPAGCPVVSSSTTTSTSSTSTSTSSTSSSSTSSTSTSVTSTTSSTSSTSTSSTSSTSTSSTTSSTAPACCGPERITLSSSAGTLLVDNLAPFPFPAGVTTVMDVAAASVAFPDCQHPAVVPAGGFFVPNFDLPALNYCSSVSPIGCDAGSPGALGGGNLWDGNGAPGLAMVNTLKSADTADGVCDTTVITVGTCSGGTNPGAPCVVPTDCTGGGTCSVTAVTSGCNTGATGAGGNTLGDIDSTISLAPGGGVRSLLDIKVHSLTWSDSLCSPAITPGCCPGSNYNPADGDLVITEFDFILSPTTGTGTGRFLDKNGNVCKRAGSGFNNPGPDGPKSLTGTPAAGPCCVVGQATTVVSVGEGFSGGAPLYDLGFQSTIPNTVASCGAFVPGGSCTPSTDPCQF